MKSGASSIVVIDAIGGALTALLVAIFAWTAFVAKPDEGQSPRELADSLDSARSDVAALRSALAEQKAMESRRQSQLAAVGPLPSEVPSESYLRTLSSLASENTLTVVRQLPLSPRDYPGLLEQRFAYEVSGTLPDLARFFKAVELSPSWTDISYLKVETGKSTEGESHRSALLTFSVFSMGKVQPVTQGTGG